MGEMPFGVFPSFLLSREKGFVVKSKRTVSNGNTVLLLPKIKEEMD